MIMSGSNCCLWILQLHTGRALACWEGQGMFCLVVLNHMIKIRDFNFNLCKEQIKIKRRASIADPTETNPTRANLVHYKSCRVNSGIKYSTGLFFLLSLSNHIGHHPERRVRQLNWVKSHKVSAQHANLMKQQEHVMWVHSKIHLLRLTKHSYGIAGQLNVHLSQQQGICFMIDCAGCVFFNLVQLNLE